MATWIWAFCCDQFSKTHGDYLTGQGAYILTTVILFGLTQVRIQLNDKDAC